MGPFLWRRLREIDGPGVDTLQREGIVSLADLDLAIAERRPAVTDPAFGRAAAALAAEVRPLTLGRAWDVATELTAAIAWRCPHLRGLQVSGATRRAAPLVPAIVAVAHAADPERAVSEIAASLVPDDVLHRDGRRLVFLFEGHEVDLRIGAPDEFGVLLMTTTGPAAHVAEVLARRPRRLVATEEEIYAQAGLAYLPPEVREAPDAIARAAAGQVPRLLERGDIRGDLHMHTVYSDGRDSLRAMVHAARDLGYEYIAITDHSEHAGASRTVTLDDLARQRDEIAHVRAELTDIAILHGLEVDILADGSLDCPDAALAELDIVLASLHDGFGHDRRRLTKRCLAAIRHPLVSVITHPTNQLVGRREGYDMDYDAIYAAAAETGTALEVDGAPSHLDLPGERAREAAAAGVALVVDSDCHRSTALDQQMRMGVGTARRGWVEARHVLNTRPLAEVRGFLARKRHR